MKVDFPIAPGGRHPALQQLTITQSSLETQTGLWYQECKIQDAKLPKNLCIYLLDVWQMSLSISGSFNVSSTGEFKHFCNSAKRYWSDVNLTKTTHLQSSSSVCTFSCTEWGVYDLKHKKHKWRRSGRRFCIFIFLFQTSQIMKKPEKHFATKKAASWEDSVLADRP